MRIDSNSRGTMIYSLLMMVFSGCLHVAASRQHIFAISKIFDDPNSWADGDHERPCAGDRIIFSADQVTSVFVQTGMTISEMVLPMDGEFIFANDVSWGVSVDLSPCSHANEPHDVHFNSNEASWFNPINWQDFTDDGTALGTLDLLDIEKIPCEHDDAIFSESSTFTAGIELDTNAKSVKVTDKVFVSTASFDEYRNGNGRYKFVGSGKVQVNNENCEDKSGCLCRNQDNYETVFDTICSFISCQSLKCENPIRPFGSCCKVCGSMQIFNYTSDYAEEDMRRYLASFTSQSQYNNVHSIISKVNERMRELKDNSSNLSKDYYKNRIGDDDVVIQILLTDDSGTGEEAKRLSDEIYDSLSSPDNGLGISSITEESSGQSKSNGMDAGTIAGIVVGSVFAVILFVILFYGLRSIPLRGKKYFMDFQLDDNSKSDSDDFGLPNITEVGPGMEFESSDYNASTPTNSKISSGAETVGWPQRGAMDSDFGVAFGNPAYDGDDL